VCLQSHHASGHSPAATLDAHRVCWFNSHGIPDSWSAHVGIASCPAEKTARDFFEAWVASQHGIRTTCCTNAVAGKALCGDFLAKAFGRSHIWAELHDNPIIIYNYWLHSCYRQMVIIIMVIKYPCIIHYYWLYSWLNPKYHKLSHDNPITLPITPHVGYPIKMLLLDLMSILVKSKKVVPDHHLWQSHHPHRWTDNHNF